MAFFSKQFSKEENRWGSSHLEALGLLKCLAAFRPYIYGIDFTVRTDNMGIGLSWLKRQTSGRLGRWAMQQAGGI